MKMRKSSQQTGNRRRRKVWIYLFLGFIGIASGWILLMHTLAKNRIFEVGRRERDAEREIAQLHQDIHVLNLKIEESLSRKNLMQSLATHRTRLRPIQPGSPILIHASLPSTR
ncbi:MAG: hypothetical protein WCN98_12410 [Verrucomicrobiaceae bacterium]